MGDEHSELEQFLAKVEARAFRMAQFATGNRDDALELVQEAMLGLAERYADRDASEWPPLFHRILQSRINDWYRRRKVRRWTLAWGDDPRGSEMPEPEFPDRQATDPADGVARQQAMAALQQALGQLPLKQQQAFLLRIWEGLDVKATAFAMNCSEGSVKTHLHRATMKLREILGEHWP
ncbi:MAG TPA: RNA polymerase sigma factor [Thiotrichales bacterium]|nr:RNA polymerase sigma factor [Thiotrichales bacterium]